MSAEAEAAPSGASSTNGTPQRADLDELLAQAELINDDELVEQLRAKKARRDAKLLEAVTIKADLQAKSDRLHQAINQRAADEAAAAAADAAAEVEREARRESQRLAREQQMQRDEEHEIEMKKLREAERKERRDRRAAAQKNAESPLPATPTSSSVASSAPATPAAAAAPVAAPVAAATDVVVVNGGSTTNENVSTPSTPSAAVSDSTTASTSQRVLTPIKPYVMSPPSIISPEREAELDATEDAALQRAKKRADERRAKKYARINDPNVSADERARLQGELSRENSQKLTEMSKLKAEHDEDHQLFSQLESSLRRVMSSKGPAGEEVLARAAEAEEVSDWIEQSGDAEALPANISQKLLARNVSRSAVEALLKNSDDNAGGVRAASTAAAPAATIEGDGFNVIRVGVIGAGKNTCERHIPLLKLIDGVRITHVANRSLESSQAVAKKFGIPNACASASELLSSDAVDAVVIGTWPYKHAEYATAALAANKHVLCEARMAMNAAEARAMQAASRAHPELVAQLVPSPYTLELDAGLARYVKEKLGRLVFVRGVCCTDAFAAVEATAPPSWRADRTLSGNNIMSMGIVYEALIRWTGRAATVAALGATIVAAQIDMPNVLALHGKLRKDDAAYQLTFSDASGLAAQNEIWLHGTKATLHVDLASKRVYFGARGDQTLREITAELKSGPGWNVEKDFVDAIRGERNVTLTDFDTGVHYMQFTDAVWESMRTGSIVTV